MTAAILSGILYDLLKHQASLTTENIKEKLQGWLIDDNITKSIETELTKLHLTDEMSENVITKKLESSVQLKTLMANIQPSNQTSIIQSHTGTGDNVAGNKINNH